MKCFGVFWTGGIFHNPSHNALFAGSANVSGVVFLASNDKWGGMDADGIVPPSWCRIEGRTDFPESAPTMFMTDLDPDHEASREMRLAQRELAKLERE